MNPSWRKENSSAPTNPDHSPQLGVSSDAFSRRVPANIQPPFLETPRGPAWDRRMGGTPISFPFHRAQVPAEHVPGDALYKVHPNLQLSPPAHNTSTYFLPDWGSQACLTDSKGLGAKGRPLAAWLHWPQLPAHVTQPSPATAGLLGQEPEAGVPSPTGLTRALWGAMHTWQH